MKRRWMVLTAAALLTAGVIGCSKKQEANPVPADDSKYVAPSVGTAPGPGGAAGAGTASKTASPNTQ